MLLRKINNIKYLFLCQSADWQCVLEAEDEETAATLSVEKVMLFSKDKQDDKFSLSMVIAVQKLPCNLIDECSTLENSIAYYSPVILANAGFHVESKNLHNFLQQQIDDENESE
jgi:hypothetical protein